MSASEEYIVFRYTGDYVPRNPITGFFEGPIDLDCLSVDLEKLSIKKLNSIFREPEVLMIYPNIVLPKKEILHKTRSYSDPRCEYSPNQSSTWSLEILNVNDSIYTGEGLSVAVIDDGFNPREKAFFSNLEKCKKIQFGNFLEQEDSTSFSKRMGGSHGTLVAGIICGEPISVLSNSGSNQKIRIGVCRELQKLIVANIFENNQLSVFRLLKSMIWVARNGADIINMSLGREFSEYLGLPIKKTNDGRQKISEVFWKYYQSLKAIEFLVDTIQKAKSCLFIASVGNESGSRRSRIHFSRLPGVVHNILSVGSITLDSPYRLDDTTNRGADFVAPGDYSCSIGNDGPSSFSSTSAASPHVTGIAALWKQALIDAGIFNLRYLIACIKMSANISHLSNYSVLDVGYGLVQAPTEKNLILIDQLKQIRGADYVNYC